MSVLSRPHFHDEAAAFTYLESVVWANGVTCPHCGACDRISAIKPNPAKRVRIGLKKCGHCKKQFTLKVGTVFEHARIPPHKMHQAAYLLTSGKIGCRRPPTPPSARGDVQDGVVPRTPHR